MSSWPRLNPTRKANSMSKEIDGSGCQWFRTSKSARSVTANYVAGNAGFHQITNGLMASQRRFTRLECLICLIRVSMAVLLVKALTLLKLSPNPLRRISEEASPNHFRNISEEAFPKQFLKSTSRK